MQDENRPSRMTAWARLRRRKVVQWSLAYVAVAWGLLQGLEFAVGAFDASEAFTRGAAVAAVFGLALVVTLAWYHGDRGHQRATRTELAIISLILVVGAPATWHFSRSAGARPPDAAGGLAETGPRTATDRRRLAVLPFVNLGADPANAAFVAGVHDTLITQVAKVPALSVIARSSVLQYEGKSPTAREVAAALLVGSVLEGSVQRDGSRLRIQARLIDAATEASLWTETFDRTADDLFAIQSEIALAIVQQLRVRLTVGEKDQVSAALTPNPRAYEHYVLGRSLLAQAQQQAAIQEFTAAVTLDPNFAAAYAQRSIARTEHGMSSRDEGWRDRGKADAERALAIDPTLPMGHHARAVYLFRGRDDMDGAAAEFEQAVAGLPGDADVHMDFGFLRRWQGRNDEAAALLVRAAELDPLGFAPIQAARTLMGLGRHAEAWRVAWASEPANLDSGGATSVPFVLSVMYDCNLAEAERINAAWEARHPELRPTLAARHALAWTTGDAAAAVAALDEFTARFPGRGPYISVVEIAHTLIQAGRVAEGRKTLQDDLDVALARLDRPDLSDGDRAPALNRIALNQALLGQRAQAIQSAQRALESLPPTSVDWVRGHFLFDQALALGRLGETDAAIDRLREMFALPVPPWGAGGVWCYPLLRPLRDDPRFRDLIAAHGGKVTIDPHDRSTWPRAAVPGAE